MSVPASLLIDCELFADLIAKFHNLKVAKHTGPVIVNLAQGTPNDIEIPGESTRIRLTKAGTRAQH